MPSNRSACMTVSTESAMTSRLTSEARIPSWPIDIPSDTAIVPNSKGYPPEERTPCLARSANRWSGRLHGVTSFHDDATPICGCSAGSVPVSSLIPAWYGLPATVRATERLSPSTSRRRIGVGIGPYMEEDQGRKPLVLFDKLCDDCSGDCSHAHHWLVERQVAGRAVERGVAVAEDATVGSRKPVATTVRDGRNAHDWLVQFEVPGGAVKYRVAVAEDASVGSRQPVATTVRGGRNAHDWLVQFEVPGGAVKYRVAVAEDASVGSRQPVATTVRGGRNAHDWLVQCEVSCGAVKCRVAVGEHATVRGNQPVAKPIGRGRHCHQALKPCPPLACSV